MGRKIDRRFDKINRIGRHRDGYASLGIDPMRDLQNIILEMVATGQALDATMARLCTEVEKRLPDVICSVLRIDRAGSLRPLAAPSLPAAFSAAIDGLEIGPEIGACGACAYLRHPVATTDIATDPNWADFKDQLLPLGIRACWSSPILGEDGAVLGSFAFYYSTCRGPRPEEEAIVDACLHLCMIALARYERVAERDRLANTDALTGLANRASFNAALDRLSCGEASAWAIMIVDLDNLKRTNDTFGHRAGDDLLQAVAERILAAAGPVRVFRLGGDEFALIIAGPAALEDMDALALRILDSLHQPAVCDGHSIRAQATIGAAMLSAADRRPEDVRQNADFALYHAKDRAKGGYVRYWPGIDSAIVRRLSAIRDLNLAIAERRLKAFYQPIFRLDSREIVGAEALCRLITRDGDIVPAADFVEALSDAHVACAVTEIMLAQVAADVRHWLDCGIPFQHVGLNISFADIQKGGLGAALAEAFARNNVPLRHLIVEITEDVYMGRSGNTIVREVEEMRALGLKVALDDFGTGFASLTHLLTVPIDILKIDKSFLAELDPAKPGGVIVEGILTIARKLGIRVVAEGVERESQAAQLQAFGCALGQGHLFSKAVDRDAMTDLLLRFAQPAACEQG
ncbi:putative bifunctional diguanylate cyclase/phosphodiesterase [Sphingomonas sp. MMS24-J13]|uniref:putative bifunctional diguanylate cyclase/phosphodiesterase n=1 Tax=Sphingomonas sp. MMS24-J13 TaxID=3238686 RepID=UPI00384B5C5A